MNEVLVKNKPTFFENKDFKTIQIKVIFPFEKSEDDYAMIQVLPGLIHLFTNNYTTEKEFTMELDRNLVLACFCVNSGIGDMNYFSFNMAIPDTFSIEDDLLERQFELFGDMIYNPKSINNKFYDEDVKREVESLRVNMKKLLDDTINYSIIHGKREIDDQGILSSSIYNHLEQIDLIDSSNSYNFYLDKVFNNNPLIYVFGNVKRHEITRLCNKYLYRNKFNNYKLKIDSRFYLKPRNEVNNVVEESNFRNSVVSLYYKVKDMTIDDEIYISMVKEILSSSSSRLLNKKLRDENDYVYSSFVINYNHFGVMGIIASINKNNVDDVILKIKEVVNDLKDENVINDVLNNIKDRKRISLIRLLDDKSSLFQDHITKDFGIDLSSSEFYEKFNKITAHDISLFIDRLVLDTIYFLKEGEHE